MAEKAHPRTALARGATVKRSFTIEKAVDEKVRALVSPREYSSYVNEALVARLQADGVAEWLRDFERDFGPLDDADRKRARKQIHAGRSTSRKR